MIKNITPEMPQFWFLLSISIAILIVKLTISFRSYVSYKRKSINIRIGFSLMCFLLFIARLFWTYLDFYLTQFDTHNIYENYLNVGVYKIATVFIGLALFSFIYSIEKSELNWKLKGIPSFTLIGLLLIIVLYPLNNLNDFNNIAKLQLFMNLFGLLIPILFIAKAIGNRAYRKQYVYAALGIIIYALGANLLNEVIMMAMRNSFGNIALYINYSLLLLFKSIGLTFVYKSVKYLNIV